ncbi:type I 3-dehydroquinate dehydratase [Archaeoglobales archaeon ex4484_92]|nr:MAG: type I 3-dehydroquinate dehydratase [Archaeoglobales archaeon ex4484_92]
MKLVATARNYREIELAYQADLVELRLDLYPFKIGKLPKMRYIISCRRLVDGGKFVGDERTRLERLKKFIGVAQYIDLEYDLPDEIFSEFDCKIIESYHNFKMTPSYKVLRDLVEHRRGDIYKIATMGKDKDDVLKIVKLLTEYENVVAFLMGRKFSFTRIFGVFLGSPLLYCSVRNPVAPGQMELRNVTKILRHLGYHPS